ncbi:MAG: hypothetical protein IT178_03185 [Acidobacteria bacterium]|nr:hypothetical protein [Acidobacteriota bacterium]
MPQMINAPLLAAVMAATLLTSGCDDSPTGPTDAAIVTFGVGNETFRALLTTREQVRAAEAARDGGRASIPVGRLGAGNGGVNTGWTWHVDDVTFVEVAIELCDAVPSYVESVGPSFGNGQYCPWSARVLDIDPVS